MATGSDTFDFGAFPGSLHITKVITGQANIVAGSKIEVWIDTKTSADHSADEHRLEPLKCSYSDIVVGVGYTAHCIYAGDYPVIDNQRRNIETPNSNRPMAYGVFNFLWAGNWT